MVADPTGTVVPNATVTIKNNSQYRIYLNYGYRPELGLSYLTHGCRGGKLIQNQTVTICTSRGGQSDISPSRNT